MGFRLVECDGKACHRQACKKSYDNQWLPILFPYHCHPRFYSPSDFEMLPCTCQSIANAKGRTMRGVSLYKLSHAPPTTALSLSETPSHLVRHRLQLHSTG
ncbi:hypothetical protein BKA60DRAFT_589064 [Fusarium oxysporum]|nr:hypothetical protein BKA60DRAFT_589064 [Fusarium oxysporum]